MARRRVIVITDGDGVAQTAVEEAARQLGCRAISASGGNPTPLTGDAICSMVKQAQGDPVLVMVDDKGHSREGKGETALAAVASDPELEVLGVVAVASNTEGLEGTAVDYSVTADLRVVRNGVTKEGREKAGATVVGDTLTVLKRISVPVVVGIGDPGKMGEADLAKHGAPVLTAAIRAIIEGSAEGAAWRDMPEA